MSSPQDFPGPNQRLAEADWSRHLVNANHRHDEGLERDPPLRKRPPRQLGEPQGHARLRYKAQPAVPGKGRRHIGVAAGPQRSEEHTSELQSPCNLVCRLLLEKKKTTQQQSTCNLVCRLMLEKKKKK